MRNSDDAEERWGLRPKPLGPLPYVPDAPTVAQTSVGSIQAAGGEPVGSERENVGTKGAAPDERATTRGGAWIHSATFTLTLSDRASLAVSLRSSSGFAATILSLLSLSWLGMTVVSMSATLQRIAQLLHWVD